MVIFGLSEVEFKLDWYNFRCFCYDIFGFLSFVNFRSMGLCGVNWWLWLYIILRWNFYLGLSLNLNLKLNDVSCIYMKWSKSKSIRLRIIGKRGRSVFWWWYGKGNGVWRCWVGIWYGVWLRFGVWVCVLRGEVCFCMFLLFFFCFCVGWCSLFFM